MASERMSPPGSQLDATASPVTPDVRAGGFSLEQTIESTYRELTPREQYIAGLAYDFDHDWEGVWLPPKKFIIKPQEYFETPVDERGLVMIPELLDRVLAKVQPEYVWPVHVTSTHHFNWPSAWYEHAPHALVNPAAFRNLPIHKGYLPRVFENVLHRWSIPPEVPSEEVMHYRVESWKVAVDLFKSIREVTRWEKRRDRRAATWQEDGEDLGEQVVADIIDRKFKGVEMHMGALASVPSEFRLIEPSNSPRELAARLGSFVVPRALPLRNVAHVAKYPTLAMVA